MVADGYYAKVPNHIWRDMEGKLDRCLRVYLWMLDKTTSEIPDEKEGKFFGVVNFGKPVSIKTIADDIRRKWSTVQRQVSVLVEEGYLLRGRDEGYSEYCYWVSSSFKLNTTEEAMRASETPEAAFAKARIKAIKAKVRAKNKAAAENKGNDNA